MWFRSLLRYESYSQEMATRRRPAPPRPRSRLSVEALEDRTLLSTFVVDRLTDTGAGTGLTGDLRYCLTQANASPGDDTITFAVTGTINLTGPLPDLNSNIDLEGLGASSLTVRRDTGGDYRIFTVASGATVILSGLTITNGSTSENGGGIYNNGTLTLNNDTVSGNTASSGLGAAGGGIFNLHGTLTLNNATVSGNSSGYFSGLGEGGGICNLEGTVTLNNTTVSGNYADNTGGIFNYGVFGGGTLTLNNSTVSGNSVAGILNETGTATLNSSTVSDNDVGGIINYALFGSSTVILNNTTVSDNYDGGILNSATSGDSTVTLNNSTVSGNTTDRPQSAGGITNVAYLTGNAIVLLVNSTIANNTVSGNGQAGSQLFSGRSDFGTGQASIQLRNTLVAGTGLRPTLFADTGGTFVSQGHNLSSDSGSGFLTGPGDLINTNPLLGSLQNNGGPTKTMALLASSPALNAGDSAQLGVADQRGVVRSGGVNIGAYQASASVLVLTGLPSSAVAGTALTAMLTAKDSLGQVAVGYVGTVHFTSTDAQAILPSDYTFTLGDAGAHTFTNGLTLATAGNRTVTATDTVTSSIAGNASVLVNPAAANHLLFLQQPTDTAAGQTMSPVIVEIADAFGNVVTADSSDTITLSLGTNPSGGTLSGTRSVTVVNGVAIFGDLSIDLAGDGYTLHATTSGLTDADSAAFRITA
jgi:hypothetical protein